MKILLSSIIFLGLILISCDKQNDDNIDDGSVTDASGNKYSTVKIGDQTWMAENLRTTKFNDGTEIPLVSDFTSWKAINSEAYCWYENDEAKYKNLYGALYNNYAVETDKLCPTGWHVPTADEWRTLVYFVGGFEIAGARLKNISGWNTEPTVFPANIYLFSALPGGERRTTAINFGYEGKSAEFWSSSSNWGLTIRDNDSDAYGGTSPDNYGLSVRCLKN